MNSNHLRWTSILMLACLVLAACNKESQLEGKKTGMELERSISEKLKADPELASADLRVTVDSDRNEIRLSGVVGSDALRLKVVDLVRSEQTSMTVVNLIDIRPTGLARADFSPELAMEERSRASLNGERIGDSLDDAWVHKMLTSKLSQEAPEEADVKIDVINAVVTLRGTVTSAERKTQIEKLASETEAVQGVQNKLQVGRKKAALFPIPRSSRTAV